jgi:hypothetical protein
MILRGSSDTKMLPLAVPSSPLVRIRHSGLRNGRGLGRI